MRVKELPDEPRLAHARLTHECHKLATTRGGLLQTPKERFHFVLSSHQACQTPSRLCLHACASTGRPVELEGLDRIIQPLDRKRAEWLDVHKPLHQSERVGREANAPFAGELFHARGQMHRGTY